MSAWEIWLRDPTGVKIDMLDTAAGFACTKVTNSFGAFAITLPPYFDKKFGVDYIIDFWRAPDSGALKLFNAYRIRKWRFYDDASGGEYTAIWGYDGNEILRRRIIASAAESAQALMTAELDDMMKAVFTDTLGADAGTGRNMAAVGGGLTVAGNLAAAPSATKAFAWQNAMELMIDLAQASRAAGTNLYFDMVPAFTSAGLYSWQFQTFTTRRGSNHGASSDNPVYFGRQWGNLQNGYYEIDHTEEENYIYGRGQGTGTTRIGQGNTNCDATDTGRSGASIWNRCEGYANASIGGGGESEASTLAEAQAKLEKGRPKWRAGGQLLDGPQARYDVDFDYGSTVVLELRGAQVDVDINAVGFSVDGSGQEQIDLRVEVEGS